MIPRILVVDRNAAFATMLKEMLETEGGYEVTVAQEGSEALALLHEGSFALTILDMDLDPDDLDARDLIPRIRKAQPSIRLMLIPLIGEELASELHQLDIQGVLAKPFFADDLLPSIENALSKEVHQADTPTPSAPPRPNSMPSAEVEATLLELTREIRADTVFLLSSKEGDEPLIARVTSLDTTETGMLANLTLAVVRAGQATASFLGQPNRPFEHNMFENDTLRLYAMSLPERMLLAVVTPTSTPLGTIRHNLRRTARRLAQLATAG